MSDTSQPDPTADPQPEAAPEAPVASSAVSPEAPATVPIAAPPGAAYTGFAGYPPGYPPAGYRRPRAWRNGWVPALVGLLVGGALGIGVTAAVINHGPGEHRGHFQRFGPPGGFNRDYGPGYRNVPRPGAPRPPGLPGAPAPAPTQTG